MVETVTMEYLRGLGRRPRLHPNGFVQLDLNEEATERFHVWPALGIAAQKTRHPIHDHAFDMQSTVLLGSLTNVLYSHTLHDSRTEVWIKGPDTYRIYTAKKIGPEETVLEPTYVAARLREISRITYGPFETYEMSKSLLHDSVATGLTATVMRKLNQSGEYHPSVFVPIGVKPDNEFRRESLPEEELWRHIEAAVEAIRL